MLNFSSANSAGLLAIGSHPGNVVITAIPLSCPIRAPLMVVNTCRTSIRATVHGIDSGHIQGAKTTSLTKRACRAISSLNGRSPSVGEGVVGVMHDRLNIIGVSLSCARSAFAEIMLLPRLNVGPIDDNVRISIRSRLFVPISYDEKFVRDQIYKSHNFS